jgi:hypothetical protein
LRASARKASTISSSLTATISPPLSRTPLSTSLTRVGCEDAMPSAIVGRTSIGTSASAPRCHAA